ncbi:MAG: TetR/AcrR family transcriptional regulator [Gammaproteobacteria bacterium]|nr:TetR/AcrR family transcriptional regulator [Gammaproteobacteria bacterium]
MATPSPKLRQPRQSRSKASQEKIFKGAIKLLTEKGPEEFTLQELSKRTKVSVGSIYYRFDNKEILLSELQKREYKKMWEQLSQAISDIAKNCEYLAKSLENANSIYAEHLRDNAPLIRAFMKIALTDKTISVTGTNIYHQSQSLYENLLLTHANEIQREQPERAVHSCFRILHVSIARYLGFGSLEPITDNLSWDEMLNEVAEIQQYYLLSPTLAK